MTDSLHLTPEEVALAAASEPGTSDFEGHLSQCPRCAEGVAGARTGRLQVGPAPAWLRDAARASYEQLTPLIAQAEARRAAARRPSSRVVLRTNWLVAAVVGAGSLGLLLTLKIGTPSQPPPDGEPSAGSVRFRGGAEPSATLSCIGEAGSHPPGENRSCPQGATVRVEASVPSQGWKHVACVVCAGGACQVVGRKAIGDDREVRFDLGHDGPAGGRLGVLIFSNQELDPSSLRTVPVDAGRALPSFDLDMANLQVPFEWSVTRGPR